MANRISATTQEIFEGIAYMGFSDFWKRYGLKLGCSFLFQLLLYLLSIKILGTANAKTKAWIPTAYVSFLCVTLSSASVGYFVKETTQFLQCMVFEVTKSAPFNLNNHCSDIYTGYMSKLVVGNDSLVSTFTSVFYVAFIFLDLLLGYFVYPTQFKILSGYVHHAVYAVLFLNAVYWQFSELLLLFFPLEIPTFVLALGRIAKTLRSDLIFGLTFLSFRLLYHLSVTIVTLVFTRHISNLWLFGIISFSLHIYWFYNWLLHAEIHVRYGIPRVAYTSHSKSH